MREHVSTCRTAEDKDRSRERALVSGTRRKEGTEGEKLAGYLMEAAMAGRGGGDGGC